MMEYPNLCYTYLVQPSLYKRNEFGLRFLLALFRKIKNSPKHPKIEIVTD